VVRTERRSVDGRRAAEVVVDLIGAGHVDKTYETGLYQNDGKRNGGSYCTPSADIAEKAREVFGDDVRLLERLLGKDFEWGNPAKGWTVARVEGWDGTGGQLRPSQKDPRDDRRHEARKSTNDKNAGGPRRLRTRRASDPCTFGTTLAVLLKHGPNGKTTQSPFADLGKEFCWTVCQKHNRNDWARVIGEQPQCRGDGLDACPRYTTVRHAEAILADHPGAKFIMLVRELVERLVSQFNDNPREKKYGDRRRHERFRKETNSA